MKKSSLTRSWGLSPVPVPSGVLPLLWAQGPGTDHSCPLSPRATLKGLWEGLISSALAVIPYSSQVALQEAFSASLTFWTE